MRKVKVREENGTFLIDTSEPYPEIKGKKLVVLTKGSFSTIPDQEGKFEWELTDDEGILLTEDEFEEVKKKVESSRK